MKKFKQNDVVGFFPFNSEYSMDVRILSCIDGDNFYSISYYSKEFKRTFYLDIYFNELLSPVKIGEYRKVKKKWFFGLFKYETEVFVPNESLHVQSR